MNEKNNNDAEVTISHASYCTALVDNKNSAIKLELSKKRTFSKVFDRQQQDVNSSTKKFQLAVINIDTTLASSVNEMLNPRNIDKKNLDKLLQSLDKIEFKSLDSLLQLENARRNKYESEVNIHMENEKPTREIVNTSYDNQMTVICSNQKCFSRFSLSSTDSDIYTRKISILRRQSLQTFARKQSSVLQRSHSWMCASLASSYLNSDFQPWIEQPDDIRLHNSGMIHVKNKRKRKKKKRTIPIRQQSEEDEYDDDLPKRAKWTIMITAFLLLVMCLSLVGITLRMAPLIDNMVQIENERLMKLRNQFYRSNNINISIT